MGARAEGGRDRRPGWSTARSTGSPSDQLIERYRAKHDLPLSHPGRDARPAVPRHPPRARALLPAAARGAVERVTTDLAIFEAKHVPPQTTRARLRGEFIRQAQERRRDFTVDWVHLKLNDQAQRTVLCKDPTVLLPLVLVTSPRRAEMTGTTARAPLPTRCPPSRSRVPGKALERHLGRRDEVRHARDRGPRGGRRCGGQGGRQGLYTYIWIGNGLTQEQAFSTYDNGRALCGEATLVDENPCADLRRGLGGPDARLPASR